MEIYKEYQYTFKYDLKTYNFNNFIILGTSYSVKSNIFCSTLMIIGYPNSTDTEFNIIEYLLNDKNNSIDNLTFELSNNFIIDNNIFGYTFKRITINNITKNGYIDIIFNSLKIEIGANITNKDELIIIEFNDNIYNKSDYILDYSYIVAEPEYENFIKYPIENITYNTNYPLTEEIYNSQKEEYIGKSIYYKIILNEDLTTNCDNKNCSLCFSKNLTCITYRPYEYNMNEIIKEYLNITKEELNISKIINEKEIGKIYEIRGIDFTLKIKPTNSSIFDNSTYIEFDECEKKIREYYNISNSSIITFFQLELDNNNKQSLINQIEYTTYNDKKQILNLSLCKDLNIPIHYFIKDDSSLDKEQISNFKDLGIDIFNIYDSFFNDICNPYSKSNNDIILEDRIKDIFQNYSLCDEGCTYNNINIDNMTIVCDCKIKENISVVLTPLNLAKEKKSSILDSILVL